MRLREAVPISVLIGVLLIVILSNMDLWNVKIIQNPKIKVVCKAEKQGKKWVGFICYYYKDGKEVTVESTPPIFGTQREAINSMKYIVQQTREIDLDQQFTIAGLINKINTVNSIDIM